MLASGDKRVWATEANHSSTRRRWVALSASCIFL